MQDVNEDKANLTLLPDLKERVVTGTDFSAIWNYFFDNFGENGDFLAAGVPVSAPELEVMLIGVGRAILKREVKLSNLMLMRVPEHRFVHGGFMMNKRFSGVIYFEDLKQGIVSVTMGPGGQTDFCRFKTDHLKGMEMSHRN